MKTKKEFEKLGFMFFTHDGGAVSAFKICKDEQGEFYEIGATAKTLITLRKKLTEIINE